ncbi:MAG TPA: hypothetical protein VF640_01895 [Acidimicrobiales bacterium]
MVVNRQAQMSTITRGIAARERTIVTSARPSGWPGGPTAARRSDRAGARRCRGAATTAAATASPAATRNTVSSANPRSWSALPTIGPRPKPTWIEPVT